MAFSGERRPLDCSLPHELTCETPCPSLKLYFLIGILGLSALSIALLIYLCVLLSRTSKKREVPTKGTNSRESVGPSYEVFLSFHGLDTRREFTDFLYHGMVDSGILVFRDSESLHVGERIGDELLQAIRNSKIYIPIFSENYASSHWCLRELAYMVECTSKSNGNKEILPIFLDVDPDDVKLKTDSYSKALSAHRNKFCTEVESWKNALVEVGKIKGWNWGEDKGQADLTQSIIKTVLDKLNIGNKKIVSGDLVGVDDHAEDIIKMLDVESNSVQFLGIHGMGGIGKTTLAKVIFDRLSSHFKDCFFLHDVRELSQSRSPVDMQKMLLSKFGGSSSYVNSMHHRDEGIHMIKRVLGDRKVLIVLDDVDRKEQLESLAKEGDWFGFGSRIIITTRDQRVLRIVREVTGEGHVEKPTKVLTYEVCALEFEDALKLFNKHAFRRDSPPDHYVSLSNEIVSTLGGLPLALEVTGSSLNNEPKQFWEATLKRLRDASFDDEVQSRLMISYDKLNNKQKQVFLDIACFFVNEDKIYPFYMWDACGYYPLIAIKDLFLMSLIKIKDDDTFWMHDLVRDLGRQIVRQENIDPCKCSRVWNYEDALSILKQKKGSQTLEALSLGPYGFFLEEIPKPDQFVGLQNLRFVQAAGAFLFGDFFNFLSRLRWLSCHNYVSIYPAGNFHLTNLVVLDLSRSKISEEKINWIKEARKLKVLDLSHCYNLRRIPNLSTLVSLEILRLHHCWRMEKLPDSIGELESLIELDLERTGIDYLPNSFSNLKQLTRIRMDDIEGGITKLPSAIWLVHFLVHRNWSPGDNLELSCLKMEDLSWNQISGLPTVASLISNIHKVELAQKDSKEWEPGWTALRKLENVMALPVERRTPSQLEKVILASPNMRFLLQLPSSSRELVFRQLATTCSRRAYRYVFPGLYECWMPIFLGISDSELEKLHMQDCTFSRRLALFYLKMRRSKITWERPQEFFTKVLEPSHMKNLQKVDLFKCKLLVEIHGLEELRSLSSLAVTYCRSIERMPDLSKLRKLRELRVGKCPKLRSLEGLNHLGSLKCLWIHDCRSLENLADTSNLDLECFQVVHCKWLPDRRDDCKRGRGCYCEMLFEGLRKSNPMELRQVLQGHPEVALKRKSEHGLIVVLVVAILFVVLLFCFFVF